MLPCVNRLQGSFGLGFAFYELECVSMKTKLNLFAIKTRIYEIAIKVAYEELQQVHQLSFEFAK
jgi:hypothetical protein